MPRGKHLEKYRRPGVGQKRRQRKPLTVERLPQEVRDAILGARANGKTWAETTEAAAIAAQLLKAAPPTERQVRTWYDLRVEQVQREVMAQAESARALAGAFAAKGSPQLPEAVRAALQSTIFSLLDASEGDQKKAAIKSLNDLGFLLARQRQLDLEEQRLGLEREKLQQIRSKVAGAKQAVAGKKKMSPAEMQKVLDEIYGLTK